MITCYFLVFLLKLILYADGLQCWTCENQPTNEACQTSGKIQICLPNQETCQNELRRGGDGIKITKRCKQDHACANNFAQNNRPAWNPFQCNTRVPSSVCRCCCNFDRCNELELACLDSETRRDDQVPGCLLVETPQFGERICNPDVDEESKTAVLDTTCTFKCQAGYRMVGSDTSVCMSSKDQVGMNPFFNNEPPVCLKKTCAPTLSAPVNGYKTCSDLDHLGSRCEFDCEEGYAIFGSPQSTCVEVNGTVFWDRTTPLCQKKVCVPTLSEPINGAKTCSDFDDLGSRCEFECDEGYARFGSPQSTCVDVNGTLFWDSAVPLCQKKTCIPTLSAPINGSKTCTDLDHLGSRCEFDCEEGYAILGSPQSTCVEVSGTLLWDGAMPVCQPTRCDAQTLRHGNVTCDDPKLNVATTCTFECVETGYTLYPATITQNTCLEDTTWNIVAPCCTRECPQAMIDFVVVLDSSSSVGAENWLIMKRFVRKILETFNVGPNQANLGIFRYNAVVDDETQILLNDFTESKKDLLEQFDKIPYDGFGTMTGQALNHARNVLFSEENGNRPKAVDVMLVITDGRSQDEVGRISELLRKDGVIIYVLGIIPPQGGLDILQLLSMAGDRDNLIIASGGFEELNNMFSGTVDSGACGAPCED